MHNIVEFLQKFHHLLLCIVFECIALTLLFSTDGYHKSVFFSSANTVAGEVYKSDAYVRHFFSLSHVNQQLTQRNVELEARVTQLSEELARRTADSSFIKNKEDFIPASIKTIQAKVVSNSLTSKNNYITIDKGSTDGVKKDMGVVSGTGVVGIVLEVGPHYSIVLPILNTLSNISCMIAKRGYFGYLKWEGGNTRLAYLNDVPRHAHFRLYDKIVTSGYSSVFPPGLPVGKILHVYNSRDGISYRMQIQLDTDFSHLRDVCVLDNSMMQERINLLNAVKDSVEKRQ